MPSPLRGELAAALWTYRPVTTGDPRTLLMETVVPVDVAENWARGATPVMMVPVSTTAGLLRVQTGALMVAVVAAALVISAKGKY